jgi:hypothetical protein
LTLEAGSETIHDVPEAEVGAHVAPTTPRSSGRRSAVLGAAFWMLAACDGSRGPDDAGVSSLDAAPSADSGAVADDDAGPPPPGAVRGSVTYDRRPISRRGLGAPVEQPASGAVLVLLRDDVEVARTSADALGRYAFDDPGAGRLELRIEAASIASASGTSPIEITDFDDNVYALRTEPGDVHVALTDLSGTLAMLATMNEGLAFAREAFERTSAFPLLRVHWEPGRSTPGGTSYASGGELWILGGPEDTDEFDTPVLLHELGHYLQGVYYPFSDVPEGNPHAGPDTDPQLAWNEGWPSFFAALAAGDPFYGDTIGDELAYGLDLSSLPAADPYLARPGEPMSQTISEWVIASTLWRLHGAGPATAQLPRSFAPLTRWLPEPVDDRGDRGRDFVDYLDGYLCLGGEPDRGVIESYLVAERGFPYDAAPRCPKPGLARRSAPIVPPRVALPGRVVLDAQGRSLREIPLGAGGARP